MFLSRRWGRLLDTLFGRPARRARRRGALRMCRFVRPSLEWLEDRRVLSTVTFDAAGKLQYVADMGENNALTVSLTAGQYKLNDPNATISLNDTSPAPGTFTLSADKHTVTGNAMSGAKVTSIFIDLKDGTDALTLGAFDAAVADLTAQDGGVMADTATITSNLTVAKNVAAMTAGQLMLSGFGTINVNNPMAGATTTVQTDGGQDYESAVALGADAVFTSTGAGALKFAKAVDGAHQLTATTDGTMTFGDKVGAGMALVSLTAQGKTAGMGAIALNGGPIKTTGTQDYTAAATLGTDTMLTASKATFASSLAGGTHSLNLTGAAEFDKAATGVTTLTVTGATTLKADVTTTGAQDYQGAVTIARSPVGLETLTGTAVKFENTLAGGGNGLKVTGAAEFDGAATGLNTLTVSGATTLKADVTTTGAQDYQGAATVALSPAGLETLTGSSVKFENTLAGGGSSVKVAGAAEFDQAVTGVQDLTVTGATTLKADVTTMGAQDYQGATTIALGPVGTVTLTGTKATFESTLAGGGNALKVTGNAEFDGVVTALSTLTVTDATTLKADVTTTGAQDYQGATTIALSPVGLETLTGTAVKFEKTLAGGGNGLKVAGAAEFDGAATGLNTLTVTGATTLKADITTTGAQDYQGTVSIALSPVGLETLTGTAVKLENTLVGGGNGLKVAGTAEFDGAVTALTSLTVTGATTLKADVTTTGAQDYQGTVTIALSPAGLETLTGTAVKFENTLAGGGNSLKVAGAAEFDGAATGLSTLTVTGATTLKADVTTTGAQDYQGAVTIARSPVGLETLTGTAVKFEKTLAGGGSALKVTGNAEFDGAVTALTALTVTGATIIKADVTTTGAQTYMGTTALALSPVGLVTLTTGTTVTFMASLDGGGDSLTVQGNGDFAAVSNVAGLLVTGNVVFGGTVSAGSVTVGGTTDINGGSITTASGQDYKDAVTLTADAVLTDTGASAITFEKTVDSTVAKTFTLTVATDGATTFGGKVGAVGDPTDPTKTTALGSLTVQGKTTATMGTTALNGGTVNTSSGGTTAGQDYKNAITLGADATLTDFGAKNVTFEAAVVAAMDGTQGLMVKTDGSTAFQGAVGGTVGGTTKLKALSVDGKTAGTGETDLNGMTVVTTGGQTYGNAIVLTTDNLLCSTMSGAVIFAKTVDAKANGGQGLTVQTNGTTTFMGAVGGMKSLKALGADGKTAGMGETDLNGMTVITTGVQSYGNKVVLTTDNLLCSTMTGAITFVKTVDAMTDGGQGLTVKTDGITTFGGMVGGTTKLATLLTQGKLDTAPKVGETHINGNVVMTAAAAAVPSTLVGQPYSGQMYSQLYANTVVLGATIPMAGPPAQTTLSSTTTAGKDGTGKLINLITFGSTVDGDMSGKQMLSVHSNGIIAFHGNVGVNNALQSLTSEGVAQSSSGQTFLNAGTGMTPGKVVTTNSQTYDNALVLGTDNLLQSTMADLITFKNTVDAQTVGGQMLTVQSDGTTTFGDPSLMPPTTTGIVGGTAALKSLTVAGFTAPAMGTTDLNGSVLPPPGTPPVTVTTTGDQTYSNRVVLTSDNVLCSTMKGAIAFQSTVDAQTDGGQGLTVLTDGKTTFSKAVGGTSMGTTKLKALSVDGKTTGTGETDLNGKTVVTTGGQTYGNAVVLTDDTSLTSTQAGDVTFQRTIDAQTDGMQGLTVTTGGTTSFNGVVGGTPLGTTKLSVLSVSASAGSTNINGGAVTTTGGQTYGNRVTIGVNDVLTSTASGPGATLTFGSTVDAKMSGGQALTATTNGDILFSQAVGGAATLSTLEVGNATNVTTMSGVSAGNVRQDAGTGTTTFNGTVSTSATAGVDLTTGGVVLNANVTNNTPAALTRFNAQTMGVQQMAGRLTSTNLLLQGGGVFTINQTGNNVGVLATGLTGAVTLRDAIDLTIGKISGQTGVATGGNLLQLNLDQGVQVLQSINTGASPITAVVGLNSTIKNVGVNIAADLVGKSATFDGTTASALRPIQFTAQPAMTTPILVEGTNVIPVLPKANTLTLQNLQMVTGTTFHMDPGGNPRNGFITFSNRATLTYKNIDRLGGISFTLSSYLDANGQTVITASSSESGASLFSGVPIATPQVNPFIFSPAFVGPNPAGPMRLTSASVLGNGVPQIIIAGGPGGSPLVTIVDGNALVFGGQITTSGPTSDVFAQFFAFDPNYLGGVNIAAGDLNGDGKAEIVASMAGGGLVRTFTNTGSDPRDPTGRRVLFGQLAGPLGSFAPYGNIGSGVQVGVAAGNAGANSVLVTAPGAGTAGLVEVFDGLTGALRNAFWAFGPGYQGGVVLAATGNYHGDGTGQAILVGMESIGTAISLFEAMPTGWVMTGQIAVAFEVPGPLQHKRTAIFRDSAPLSGVGSVAFGEADLSNRISKILVGSAHGQFVRLRSFLNIFDQAGTNVTGFPIAFLKGEVQVGGTLTPTTN